MLDSGNALMHGEWLGEQWSLFFGNVCVGVIEPSGHEYDAHLWEAPSKIFGQCQPGDASREEQVQQRNIWRVWEVQ